MIAMVFALMFDNNKNGHGPATDEVLGLFSFLTFDKIL